MSIRIMGTVLVVALCAMSGRALGQSPRKILVEEFTNASSQDAAHQDSIFSKYINGPDLLDYAVPIIYHTNFPGRDSLNSEYPALNNSRVALYSVSQVPSVRVNGRIAAASGGATPGSAADTGAIAGAVNAVRGTMSPITITVVSHQSDSDIVGDITVTSATPLAGARLSITAVEMSRYIGNAGTNGSQSTQFIPRTTFSVDISLAAGETKHIPATFRMGADWRYFSTYIAAFVQDTTTKEVLQAQHNIMLPRVAGSQEPTIDSTIRPHVWTGTLATTSSGNFGIDLFHELPAGWTFRVEAGGRSVATGDSIPIEAGTPVPLSVTITPTTKSPSRVGNVVLTITGSRGYSGFAEYTLYSGKIETILLLRDFIQQATLPQFENALDGINRTYAFVSPPEESLFDLSRFVTVYVMGQSGFTAADIAQLKNTIDNGGRVLISGAEVAYALADTNNPGTTGFVRDSTFLRNYLHASYVGDDGGSATVVGAAGDPVGNGATIQINNGVKDNGTPDWIEPRDGAVPIFSYANGDDRTAGIRYEGDGNRFIYLAFGLEGIGSSSLRSGLLGRSIEWLTGTSGVVGSDAAASGASLGAPWPNPASTAISVPVALEHAAQASIALYDMRGACVAEPVVRALQAGPNLVRIDCAGLPAGAYRVVLRSGADVRTAMVNVVR